MEIRERDAYQGSVEHSSEQGRPPSGFWLGGGMAQWNQFLTMGAIARALLVVSTTWLVGWVLWRGRSTLLPFAFGILLALVLAPLVRMLGRWMPRRAAIIVLYVLALSGLSVVLYYGGPWLSTLLQSTIDDIPQIEEIRAWASGVLSRFENRLPPSLRDPLDQVILNITTTLQTNATAYLQGIGTYLLNQTMNLVQVIALLAGFVVLPFWLYFVLDVTPEARTYINQALHPLIRADVWAIWSLFNRVVGAYVRGTLILGLIIGVMVAIGMWILRWLGFEIPNILLLSIFSGIGELVPFIGPVVSSVPAVGVMLGGSFNSGLAMLVVYVAVQQLESNLFVPYIVGEATRVHPAVMTVALFAAGGAFGFTGIILAPPLTALGRDWFVYLYSRFQGHTPERAYERAHPRKSGAKQGLPFKKWRLARAQQAETGSRRSP